MTVESCSPPAHWPLAHCLLPQVAKQPRSRRCRPSLSTHALDTYTGKQAAGIRIDLYDARQPHHLPFQITPWTQSSSVLPG